MTVRTSLSSFDFLQFVQKLWGVLSSPAIRPTEHILGHDTAFCDITRGFGERPNQGGKAWVSSSMKTCGVHVSSGACCHKAKGELNSRLDLLLTLLRWFYNLWEKKNSITFNTNAKKYFDWWTFWSYSTVRPQNVRPFLLHGENNGYISGE